MKAISIALPSYVKTHCHHTVLIEWLLRMIFDIIEPMQRLDVFNFPAPTGRRLGPRRALQGSRPQDDKALFGWRIYTAGRMFSIVAKTSEGDEPDATR